MSLLSQYLVVYLEANDISVPQFAKELNLYPTQIYRLIKPGPNRPIKNGLFSNKRFSFFDTLSNALGMSIKDFIDLYNEDEKVFEKLLENNLSLTKAQAMEIYRNSKYIKRDIVKKDIPSSQSIKHISEVSDPKSVKVVKFFDLNNGYGNKDSADPSVLTSDQIISQILKNDEDTYPELYNTEIDNYQTIHDAIVGADDGQMWIEFMIEYQDYCRYLVTGETPPKIVGDWQLISLEKEIFESILSAEGKKNYEGTLTLDDVRKMSSRSNQEYDIFILNFSTVPLYSEDKYIKLMELSFVGALKKFVDDGIKIGRLLARPCNKKFEDIYRDDFGFVKVEKLEDVVNNKYHLYKLDDIEKLFRRFPEIENQERRN